MHGNARLAIFGLAATSVVAKPNPAKWRRDYGWPTITVTETVTETGVCLATPAVPSTVTVTAECSLTSALPEFSSSASSIGPTESTFSVPFPFSSASIPILSTGVSSGTGALPTIPTSAPYINATSGISSTAAIPGTATTRPRSSSVDAATTWRATGTGSGSRPWPIHSSRPFNASRAHGTSTRGKPSWLSTKGTLPFTSRPATTGLSSTDAVSASSSTAFEVTSSVSFPSITEYPIPTTSLPYSSVIESSSSATEGTTSSAEGFSSTEVTASISITTPGALPSTTETDLCTEETYTPSATTETVSTPSATFSTGTFPTGVTTISEGVSTIHVSKTITSSIIVTASSASEGFKTSSRSAHWGTGTGTGLPHRSSSSEGTWGNYTSTKPIVWSTESFPASSTPTIEVPTDSTSTLYLTVSETFIAPTITPTTFATSETSGLTITIPESPSSAVTVTIPVYSPPPSSFFTSSTDAISASSSSAVEEPSSITFTEAPVPTTTEGYDWGSLTSAEFSTSSADGMFTSSASSAVPTWPPVYGGGGGSGWSRARGAMRGA